MNDAVSNAIAAAQNAAAQSTAVAPVQQTASAVVAPLPAGKPRTLADAIATAGNSVDDYLKVDKAGITIGSDPQIFDKLDGTIKLAEAKFPYMVRYSLGGNTMYAKSYDGIREVRSGKPWADAVAEACRLDPKCNGQYDAVEFVFVLTSEVKGKEKTFPAGTRLGHTTSVTGYAPVMSWMTAASSRVGANDNNHPVQLTHKPMVKGQNKWGLIIPNDLAA